MHVLGIDAGGTKTVALLADADGRILGEGRAGAANLQTEGELEVEKTLHTAIENATDGQQLTVAAVCLGVAGVDRQDDASVIRGVMRRLGFRSNRARPSWCRSPHSIRWLSSSPMRTRRA